jgi:hypothetical protein
MTIAQSHRAAHLSLLTTPNKGRPRKRLDIQNFGRWTGLLRSLPDGTHTPMYLKL